MENMMVTIFSGTVRELRERLKEYPDNAKVMGWDGYNDCETDITNLHMDYDTNELRIDATN